MNTKIKRTLERAILADDAGCVGEMLCEHAALAMDCFGGSKLYRKGLLHWVYEGDTWLHLAAAGHRWRAVDALLAGGAQVHAALSRRKATPLHYAADGVVGARWHDSKKQVKTIELLIRAGADVDSRDAQGATPLHRAVRSRCYEAVVSLLESGTRMDAQNAAGSTCFHLAVQNTGKEGAGKLAVTAAQRQIIREFLNRGAALDWKGAGGKTVWESATTSAGWVRELLSGLSWAKKKR